MNAIIQGIKIKTDLLIDNESFGLYKPNENFSEFRFSESSINSDVVETSAPEIWKDGFISKNGIGNIVKTSDLAISGGVIESNDITIRLKNTNNFFQFLETNVPKFQKYSVEIYEFIITANTFSSRLVTIKSIEDIKWGVTELVITIKMSMSKNRNRNIGTVIDKTSFPYAPDNSIDKMLPIMFGSSDPLNGRFFVLPKINAREELIKTSYFADQAGVYNEVCYPKNMSIFPSSNILYEGPPISGNESRIGIAIRIGKIIAQEINDVSLFTGKYIFCKEGVEENNGLYRKILSAQYYFINGENDFEEYTGAPGQIGNYEFKALFILSNYLAGPSFGNNNGTAENQAWFNILDLACEYSIGSGIKGFFNSVTGTEQNKFPEIYGKNGEVIEKIFSFFCKIEIANNKLIFDPTIFNGTPKAIKSLHMMDVVNFLPCSHETLELFGDIDMDLVENGVYSNDGGYGTSEPEGIEHISDRNSSTYFEFQSSASGGKIWNVFTFKPPKLDTTFKFKNVYLGIKALFIGNSPPQNGEIGSVKLYHRGYIGKIVTDFDIVLSQRLNNTVIDDIPDYYYTDVVNTKDKNFYVSKKTLEEITGLSNFKLNISETTAEDFNNIEEFALIFKRDFSGPDPNMLQTVTINDLCLIFELEQNIEDEVYA